MGKTTERFDSEKREKVQCRLCNKWYHRADAHITKAHAMALDEYQTRFPGAPTMSDYARNTLSALPAAVRAAAKSVEKETPEGDSASAPPEPEPFRFGVARLLQRMDLTEYDMQFVPLHDEEWVPGKTENANLEYLALGMEDNENVLIVGPPGTGKTTLARELAAICGQPLRRLPFNGEMRLSDLIGSKELTVDPKTGQTVTSWNNGPLPDAIERGHWALFDEFDSAPSSCTFVLHSVMEDRRQLTLMGRDSGHEVAFHDKFRIIATANTLGYGDDSGLYAGTAPMNEALLDRFGVVIRVGYPDKAAEINILTSRTKIKESWAASMVDIATQVREAQKNQTTMVSVSPRRLIMWAAKAVRLNDVRRAAQVALLNKLPPDDSKFIEGLVQRHFGTR